MSIERERHLSRRANLIKLRTLWQPRLRLSRPVAHFLPRTFTPSTSAQAKRFSSQGHSDFCGTPNAAIATGEARSRRVRVGVAGEKGAFGRGSLILKTERHHVTRENTGVYAFQCLVSTLTMVSDRGPTLSLKQRARRMHESLYFINRMDTHILANHRINSPGDGPVATLLCFFY